MLKYRVIDYHDVWGNRKDGWEINDSIEVGIAEIPYTLTKRDILQALKEIGYFKKHVRTNMFIFNGYGPDTIEIRSRKDDKPLCRLEKIRQ